MLERRLGSLIRTEPLNALNVSYHLTRIADSAAQGCNFRHLTFGPIHSGVHREQKWNSLPTATDQCSRSGSTLFTPVAVKRVVKQHIPSTVLPTTTGHCEVDWKQVFGSQQLLNEMVGPVKCCEQHWLFFVYTLTEMIRTAASSCSQHCFNLPTGYRKHYTGQIFATWNACKILYYSLLFIVPCGAHVLVHTVYLPAFQKIRFYACVSMKNDGS